MVVAFQTVQLAQASSNVAKWFFDICNAEMAQTSKKHFATFHFFVKMKLVPIVHAETPQP